MESTTINDKESTINDVLDAVGKFSEDVEKRFNRVEATMVTKNYLNEKLDEKLADLRGDLVVLMRKEDHKLKKLIDILQIRQVISDEDVKAVLSLEPFPQL